MHALPRRVALSSARSSARFNRAAKAVIAVTTSTLAARSRRAPRRLPAYQALRRALVSTEERVIEELGIHNQIFRREWNGFAPIDTVVIAACDRHRDDILAKPLRTRLSVMQWGWRVRLTALKYLLNAAISYMGPPPRDQA